MSSAWAWVISPYAIISARVGRSFFGLVQIGSRNPLRTPTLAKGRTSPLPVVAPGLRKLRNFAALCRPAQDEILEITGFNENGRPSKQRVAGSNPAGRTKFLINKALVFVGIYCAFLAMTSTVDQKKCRELNPKISLDVS